MAIFNSYVKLPEGSEMVDGPSHLWFHLLTMVTIKAFDQEKAPNKSDQWPSHGPMQNMTFGSGVWWFVLWLQELLWLKKSSTGIVKPLRFTAWILRKKTIHELKLDQKPTISSVVPYSPTNVPVRDSWWICHRFKQRHGPSPGEGSAWTSGQSARDS